jgi:hypothetical protein
MPMPRHALLIAWVRQMGLAMAVATVTPTLGHGQVTTASPSGSNPAVLVDPGAGSPASLTWNWGELVAGQSYGGSITITNLCSAARPVGIFVSGLPNLLIPLEATIPANGQVELSYLIDAPSGKAGNVTGQLAVWAPAGSDPNCSASRVAYQVNGYIVHKVGEAWGGPWVAPGTKAGQTLAGEKGDDPSQVDRLDRYDYDGDGNFDEPDGYADELDPVAADEGDRGYSYAHWFRRFQRAENASIADRRAGTVVSADGTVGRSVGGVVDIETRPGSNEFHGGILAFNRATSLAANVSQPVDVDPNQDPLRRYFTVGNRFAARAREIELAIERVGTNPPVVASAAIDPESQYVVADQATVAYLDNAVVMVSRGVPRRRLAGWLRPSPPRLSIASPTPHLPLQGGTQKSTTASPSAAAVDDLLVYVTSTGPLGAGAFRAVLVNGTGVPITLGKSVAVLEPVARLTAQDVERELKAVSHLPQKTVTLDGYCLERTKAAPKAGMVFRMARPGAKARYGPTARVLASARRLRDQKALTPDVDPDDYQHSIVQWAIWAQQERFDEKAFAVAFAAYTKKNVLAAGAKWTREMDAAVAEIVPNRWRDISRIVEAASPRGVATTVK